MQIPAMRDLSDGQLLLEPLTEAHAAEMFVVLSDLAIYEFENEPPDSLQTLRQRYARWSQRHAPDNSEIWLNWVVRLPSEQLAGYVQASVQPSGMALIAYELASVYWRQGIGRAAVRLMMQELVARYEVGLCAAVFKSRNVRSHGLLRSLGFTPTIAPGWPLLIHEADEMVLYCATQRSC